jgi:hypothetical protein
MSQLNEEQAVPAAEPQEGQRNWVTDAAWAGGFEVAAEAVKFGAGKVREILHDRDQGRDAGEPPDDGGFLDPPPE